MEKEYKEFGCYTKKGLKRSCENCCCSRARAKWLYEHSIQLAKLPEEDPRVKDNYVIRMVGCEAMEGTITKDQFDAAERGDLSSLGQQDKDFYDKRCRALLGYPLKDRGHWKIDNNDCE